jgi:hypothetical protein
MYYINKCWSALATAPAETSAEAKEAFTFNKISSSSHYHQITYKELSYGFEILHGLLHNLRKRLALKNPPHHLTMISHLFPKITEPLQSISQSELTATPSSKSAFLHQSKDFFLKALLFFRK